MDLQLEGKRVLVTGSSTRIGECIAKVLAREGALVAVYGRERERTNEVAEEIVAKGGKALADYINAANFRVDGGSFL